MVSHGTSVHAMSAPRCQDLARLNWDLGFPIRPLFVSGSLLVADWHCHGEVRPWSSEHVRYHQIELPREGAHLRRYGKGASVVDPTLAAVDRAGEEYALRSPSPHPQASTILCWRGDIAHELDRGDSQRVRSVSAHAARVHVALLRASDVVGVEEAALSLVHVLTTGDEASWRSQTPTPGWRRLADDAQHVIATRYGERMTLSAIAAACKCSPFHLSRVFRAVRGITVHRQLVRVRLRMALFALDHGADDLARIALQVGFSSHSHLTRAFRLEFGSTPSACRGRATGAPAHFRRTAEPRSGR
jgi:AraC-like DNA-binding protein